MEQEICDRLNRVIQESQAQPYVGKDFMEYEKK